MPDDDTQYPPQFASSDLTSLLGQITDFSGTPPPPPPPPAPPGSKRKSAPKAAPGLGSLVAGIEGLPVPVTIKSIDGPKMAYFNGLREILIGVSIIRLAEQLNGTQSSSSKPGAIDLGTNLIKSGASRLASFEYKSPC